MCHDFLLDASFYQSLFFLDQCIAEQVQKERCPRCTAALHVSHYSRKPRGVDRALLGESYEYRFSFCCERDGCRKRCTPPSVRFLGRKVYLGLLLTLLCAREQGLSARGRRLSEVDALLDAPDRNTWFGRRDHAFILMAVQTGLRVSEITGTTRDDLALGTGAHVRVVGKGRKERCTPLAKPTVAVLKMVT